MNDGSSNPVSSWPGIRWWMWRAFWALLAVGHVQSLFATLGDGRWASAAVLLVSEVFFLLKLLDVSTLRLPTGRRSMLSFAAILLLLHAPVLTKAASYAEQPLPWHLMVIGASAAGFVAVLVRRNNRIARVTPRVLRTRAHNQIAQLVYAMLTAYLPSRFLLRRSHTIDRSPPSPA
jgi:hypothetical protein